MRLSFPGDDKDPLLSAKDQPEAQGAKRRNARSQASNMSAPPPGRWSLTIRNQLPGDGDPGQRGVSVSMTPATPQENRPNDVKRSGRAATSDKSRRPLSLIWPRLHQEINSVAAHEVSEAETVLSVTGAAIQRRSRLLAHRR
ncbi:uncharacterized protein LOC117652173 [Thrips palmi]|uniref:Uncharacterized protein LOC117652173 n=1 Tax=Thrips palmi TaxID=161013 RepID=A0A6P9A4D6_THRPL|nr:uncharacterized protein LOC117652173 [Thrips palmi]